MSNKKFIIDADDETSYRSLVNGSAIANTQHLHRSTVRTVTSSDTVVLSDENNLINVSSSRTAVAAQAIDSAVASIDGFQFKVRVEYNATYDVTVAQAASSYWILNGEPTKGTPITYVFSIGPSGETIPENSNLVLYEPS